MDWYYSAEGAAVGPHSADEIESLFASRQITAETLVWRKGLAEWTPLADTPEFAHLIDDALPPPLPAARQQATAYAADGDVLVADRVGDYRPGSDRTDADESYRADDDESQRAGDDESHRAGDDGEPAFTLAPAPAAHALAGPWTRYFARSIDISIIATVLLTGIYWVLPWVNPKLYLQVYFVDPRAMVFLLLPVVVVINAVIITLTGNSLGKAIFAIRAEPVDGRPRFGLGGNLKREFRVWAQGLGLGIPLVNIFTMVSAYRAVLAGSPAPYDTKVATVRAHSQNRLRRTLGILFGLALYAVITAVNLVDKRAIDALELPSAWTNPTTAIATTIPAGWQYEAVTGPDGTTLFGFTYMKTGLTAFLGVETADNIDMATYTAALARGMGATTPLGNWSTASLPGVWTASGQMAPDGFPTTVYAAQTGNQFWRIVYIDQFSTTPREIIEPELTQALFRSVGVGG